MSKLNYQTHGDNKNPAILLLHGFMSCNGQWLLNIEALSEQYHLVCVELWGHGESPIPPNSDQYSLAAYYAQFEAIRFALGINSWAVIGQSYGVGIVLNYALAHPKICTAAVATNSRSAFSVSIEETANAKPLRAPPVDLRKLPYHPIHARRFPAWVKQILVANADAMTTEAVRLSGRLGTELNCRQLVDQFPLPLLITNGKYEKSFQTDLESLAEIAPELNVVSLHGGHSVNIEAADEFNAAVLGFLKTN